MTVHVSNFRGKVLCLWQLNLIAATSSIKVPCFVKKRNPELVLSAPQSSNHDGREVHIVIPLVDMVGDRMISQICAMIKLKLHLAKKYFFRKRYGMEVYSSCVNAKKLAKG